MARLTSRMSLTRRLSGGPVHPGCLAIAVLLLALQACGDGASDALRYERAAIAHGQLWRLVTGNLVHFGWPHCLLNVAVLLGLGAILPAPWHALRTCALLSTGIGMALFLTVPGLQHYAGFSGVNYGLAVLALWPRMRDEPVAGVVLAVVVTRVAWQWLGTGTSIDAAWLGAPPLAAAHVAGLCGGAVLAMPGARRIMQASWMYRRTR